MKAQTKMKSGLRPRPAFASSFVIEAPNERSVVVRYQAICGHTGQAAGFADATQARRFLSREATRPCMGCE